MRFCIAAPASRELSWVAAYLFVVKLPDSLAVWSECCVTELLYQTLHRVFMVAGSLCT